jgi:hypothetical protein
MASNAKALSFLSGDLSLSGSEVSINVAGSVQSDSITGSTIIMKNTGSTIVASDGTTAVLSESGGTVTLTADEANVGSNALVVDSSGNVGIGTNSPSQTLTIYNGYDNQIKLQNGANANQSYEFGRNGSNGLLTFYGNQNGYTGYVFDGVDGERMRIDSSGNVLVGLTDYTTAVDNGTTGVTAGADGRLTASRAGVVAFFNREDSDGSIVDFRKDGTSVGSISTNANSLPSDRNFKKDIYELEFGLDLVKKLKPKTYRYKINDDNSPFMIGLVAQDLEESLLEVGVNQNDCWILQHNENVEDGNSKYQLDYSRLIPILAKAIQEQQALIESQQSQIDTLTAKTQEQDFTIASLISRIEALENA